MPGKPTYKELERRVEALEKASHERTRAQEALRDSEFWFRSLIELGISVYAVVGARGEVIYASPSLERVYGWKPEEIVGKNIFDSKLQSR